MPSVGYNFKPGQEVEQKGPIFSMWNLVSKLSGIEELQFDHAQIL